MYNNCGGPRLAQYVRNIHATLLAALTPEQVLDFTYGVQLYGEQPLDRIAERSEEHTSELQSRGHIVCRLLLETIKYASLCFTIHDSLCLYFTVWVLHAPILTLFPYTTLFRS